jgi:hypothetical protein
MTARSLPKSLSARNTLFVTGQNKKLMIVICILQALGIPMVSGVLMLNTLLNSHQLYLSSSAVSLYSVVGCMCLCAAVFIGIAAAISVFQELWKRSKVDMIYSLPLTNKQRFFSHYTAGMIVYLLPYIVAVILGWLIIFAFSVPIDFSELGMTRISFLTMVCKYYSIGTTGLLLLMLLYYTATVLLVTCCGTLFESIYTTLLLNILIPGTLVTLIAVICSNISNMSFWHSWQSIGFTSPIGGLVYLVYIMIGANKWLSYSTDASASEAIGHGLIPSFLRWGVIILFLSAVLFVAALLLYRHRRAEAVGKTFVYKGAYYFMLTLITVWILCLTDVGILGAALLLSGIVYFVMEVIRKRGFSKFWLTAITYTVTVAVTLGVFQVIDLTQAFGRAYYIPSPLTVSSMEISLPLYAGSYYDVKLEYTNEDVIAGIQEIQKEIVREYRESDSTTSAINRQLQEEQFYILKYSYTDDDDDYQSYSIVDPQVYNSLVDNDYYSADYSYDVYGEEVDAESWVYNYASVYDMSIIYYTYSGTEICREYKINFDQYADIMNIIQGTELYASALSDFLYINMNNSLEEYENGNFYIPDKLQLYLETDDYNTQYMNARGGISVISAFSTSYFNDLCSMTAEQFRTSGIYGYFYDLPIWNACTETVALLESYGAEPFAPADIYEFNDADAIAYYDEYSIYDTLSVQIYASGDWNRGTAEYNTGSGKTWGYVKPDSTAYSDIYCCNAYSSLKDIYPELYKLLEAADADYITKEDCYALVVNGEWYIVPPEKSDLAEAVIANGDYYMANRYYTDEFWGNYYDNYYSSYYR